MKISKSQALVGALVVGVVALLAWAFWPQPLLVETVQASTGRFERSINDVAKTQLRDRYLVSAPLAGRLNRMALREGQTVTQGMVLATIAPSMPALLDERTQREARARVETADAMRTRATTRIERARVALQQARIDVRRSEQLSSDGFVSPNKLETDKLSLRVAENELALATQEADAAGHELEQARALVQRYASPGPASNARDPRAWPVTSPVAGQVLKIAQTSEAAVVSGAPLVEIGDLAQLEIMAEILTSEAVQIRPGAPVVIERWGGGGSLQGRVRLVEPAAFTKVSALGVQEQRVAVLIDITSPREQWATLGDGFGLDVRIVVESAPQALLLPLSAIFPWEGGNAAFALEAGRAKLKPLELVSRNTSHAWIKSGASEGQAFVAYPPQALRDGARVRVRELR
jgi:HlyD family secretion protein